MPYNDRKGLATKSQRHKVSLSEKNKFLQIDSHPADLIVFSNSPIPHQEYR